MPSPVTNATMYAASELPINPRFIEASTAVRICLWRYTNATLLFVFSGTSRLPPAPSHDAKSKNMRVLDNDGSSCAKTHALHTIFLPAPAIEPDLLISKVAVPASWTLLNENFPVYPLFEEKTCFHTT